MSFCSIVCILSIIDKKENENGVNDAQDISKDQQEIGCNTAFSCQLDRAGKQEQEKDVLNTIYLIDDTIADEHHDRGDGNTQEARISKDQRKASFCHIRIPFFFYCYFNIKLKYNQ